MPTGIGLIDRIIPRIGIAVGPDGVGEPADGAALDGGVGADRVVVVRVDEDPDDRVVPAGVQVEQAGVGVVALADEAALVEPQAVPVVMAILSPKAV